MNETWLPVPGFAGYEVSNLGSVRNATTKRHLRLSHERCGYVRASLSAQGKIVRRLAHALVLSAFVCERPPGKQCDHINGDRKDNRVENLRWLTPSENARAKCERNGGQPYFRGTKSVNAKLTEKQARLVVWCHSFAPSVKGWMGTLAEAFGVSRTLVDRICWGQVWKHCLPDIARNRPFSRCSP